MTFQVGDRVVAEAESTERRARAGTIREVLREDPAPRYRIDWDDGHTSVYTPAAGALHAERPRSEAAADRVSAAQRPAATYRRRAACLGRASSDGR